MFDKIDGENASPENNNNELGFFYRRSYTFALKFTIPPS